MKQKWMAVSLASALTITTSSAFANMCSTQLTDSADYASSNFVDQNESGDIVWQKYENSDGDIYLYVHADGSVINLTNTPGRRESDPKINNNGQVVWWGHDGIDYEIYLYDMATSVTTLISDTNYHDFHPQINDSGDIAWTGPGGVYLYDGSTSTTSKIAHSGYEVQINASSDLVWRAHDGVDYEIFFYNSATSSATQLTNNSGNDQHPRTNDSGLVVWAGDDGNLYSYDKNTLITTQISNAGGAERPKVNSSGDIVWAEGAREVFLYKSSTSEITQLTNNASNAFFAAYVNINDLGDVVWRELSFKEEIFFYDSQLGTTTQLTGGELGGGYMPQINNSGHVAWPSKQDHSSTEIFRAEPCQLAPSVAPTGGGTYEILTVITLGGEVSDNEGDTLTYSWYEGSETYCAGNVETIAGGTPVQLPSCLFPVNRSMELGTHVVTLEVNDGVNPPVTAGVKVDIVDSSFPTLAPVPNVSILSPPNNQMVDIIIQVNASDNSGFVTLSADVSSDDADAEPGEDFTAPILGEDTVTLQLRAERASGNNIRTYTVSVTATDGSGNSSSADVNIVVPNDMRPLVVPGDMRP